MTYRRHAARHAARRTLAWSFARQCWTFWNSHGCYLVKGHPGRCWCDCGNTCSQRSPYLWWNGPGDIRAMFRPRVVRDAHWPPPPVGGMPVPVKGRAPRAASSQCDLRLSDWARFRRDHTHIRRTERQEPRV